MAASVQIVSITPPDFFCPGETITVNFQVKDGLNSELDGVGAFSSGATLANGDKAFIFGAYPNGTGPCPGPGDHHTSLRARPAAPF